MADSVSLSSTQSEYEIPLPVSDFVVKTLNSFQVQSSFVEGSHKAALKPYRPTEEQERAARRSRVVSTLGGASPISDSKSPSPSKGRTTQKIGWLKDTEELREKSSLELESLLSSFTQQCAVSASVSSETSTLNPSFDDGAFTAESRKKHAKPCSNFGSDSYETGTNTLQEEEPEFDPMRELEGIISKQKLIGIGNDSRDHPTVASKASSVESSQEASYNISSNFDPLAGPPYRCMKCKLELEDEFCRTSASLWHPGHFNCFVCNTSLIDCEFYEIDYELFCRTDYELKFLKKCATCDQYVYERIITACGKSYHLEHFNCYSCETSLEDAPFFESKGQPYCKACYSAQFAPLCLGCKQPITEGFMNAMGSTWHPSCFVCMTCKTPFHGGVFHVYEKYPYCELHYHEIRGTLCFSCKKPITGAFVTSYTRKFHPEHFTCTYCRKKLSGNTYKEFGEKPYCITCCSSLAK